MSYSWQHSGIPEYPPGGGHVVMSGSKQYGPGFEDYYELRGEFRIEAVGGPGGGDAMETVIAVKEALVNDGFDVTFTSPTSGTWTLVEDTD